MEICQNYEVWFVIGSQHLYGEETLRQVQRHAETVVAGLNNDDGRPAVEIGAQTAGNVARSDSRPLP